MCVRMRGGEGVRRVAEALKTAFYVLTGADSVKDATYTYRLLAVKSH